MHSRPRDTGCGAAGGGRPPPGRTVPLVLGFLVALAQASVPGGPEETLGEIITMDLEASMHSSVLSELLATASDVAEGTPTTVPEFFAPTEGAPPGIPDSSAVVGQVFQMRLPPRPGNGSCNIQLTEMGKESLPSWLHWGREVCILRGLALDQDKGVLHISVSGEEMNREASSPALHNKEGFSVEVYPEERADTEPALLALQSEASGQQPFTCGSEEPVTVLTIILDADLTKMDAQQRVNLLGSMRKFSGVPLEHMRVVPVVNNRLFDMSAFMAGPGNAKKVVENGALLSWKLGCALDQSNIPDISSVQSPAKDGTMSAKLGYPVVGWHIVNKKPHVVKRIRRQLYNTPTPVPSLLPPTTHPEPPVRIVPTPTSPSIAPATDHSAPPVRGPLPLPVKPTIRVRDQIAHTPVMGPPQPTRVIGTTSTIPIQPTMTRPVFVEATALPTPQTTKRPKTSPTKKAKRPKTSTPAPREPKSTTAKPPRRTTLQSLPPDYNNRKPEIRNPIDEVNAWVGTYFEIKIPPDTFFDREDGTTDKLRLTLKKDNEVVSETSWIQFNSTIQLLYGLPEQEHEGKHEYFMLATDKGGMSTIDAFEVRVNRWTTNDKPAVVFTARFHGDPDTLTGDIQKKILLTKKLAYALGDRNSSTVTLQSITKGSIVVEWTNNSLQQNPCPKDQINVLSNKISDPQGRPKPAFTKAMEPEFKPINISIRGANKCQSYTFVPPGEVVIPATPSATPSPDTSRRSSDDVYLHTVIPAVVVAALLLTAGVIAMVCYRKKRKGKMTIEEQATFIKKGVPIIFADELDDSKSPPSSSIPLILQEEKPPLPPPEYPNMAGPHSTLLNQDLLEDYSIYQDEDPNAPPYQPPPPFTIPIEGKGSRPKNMTAYRSPPPYVPP